MEIGLPLTILEDGLGRNYYLHFIKKSEIRTHTEQCSFYRTIEDHASYQLGFQLLAAQLTRSGPLMPTIWISEKAQGSPCTDTEAWGWTTA